MNLELTPDRTHYQVGARAVPRVSTIIRVLQLARYPDDPAALARGEAAHLCIRYMLENRLDPKTVDPIVKPYVDAAAKVISDLRIKPIAIERPVLSPIGYAGTPDLLCTFGNSQERCVLDWKSGKIQAAGALQLVAYAAASSAAPIGRIGCELGDDGSYNLVVFRAKDWRADWRAWLGAVSLYQWVVRMKKR